MLLETPFIISPPFGSYLGFRNATSVVGSFTLHRRPGRFGKTIEFFWENFRKPIPYGWVNHIGLRNPGIQSLTHLDTHIYSLVGLEEYDWEVMSDICIKLARGTRPWLELNLGCPNVHEYSIPQVVLDEYCRFNNIIIKLPADQRRAMKIAEMAVSAGARYVHAANTLTTNRGGVSGYPLLLTNIDITEAVAREFPTMPIIGGGGIYTFDDLRLYRDVGATVFSFSTGCFRPWRVKRIINQYGERYEGLERSNQVAQAN